MLPVLKWKMNQCTRTTNYHVVASGIGSRRLENKFDPWTIIKSIKVIYYSLLHDVPRRSKLEIISFRTDIPIQELFGFLLSHVEEIILKLMRIIISATFKSLIQLLI